MDALLVQSPSQLSLHLKSLRKARKVTQAQLAQRLRITQSRYAQMERNPESISTARLLDIFAALGVDVILKLRQGTTTTAPIRRGEDW